MLCKRIVFTKQEVAKLLNYEVSEPEKNEVQVRLMVSTISSGTERANLMGSKTVSWCCPEEEARFPRYVGYSAAGIIIKVGENVENFAVGDRVALSWSTHSEVLNINAKNVHKLEYWHKPE